MLHKITGTVKYKLSDGLGIRPVYSVAYVVPSFFVEAESSESAIKSAEEILMFGTQYLKTSRFFLKATELPDQSPNPIGT